MTNVPVEQMNQAALIEHLNFIRDPPQREVYLQCGDMAQTFQEIFLWVTEVVSRNYQRAFALQLVYYIILYLQHFSNILMQTSQTYSWDHFELHCCSAGCDLHTGCTTLCKSCAIVPLRTDLLWQLYLLFTLVLDSLYHRLISMPPEMSIAKPPWNSALAFRPDCSWIT